MHETDETEIRVLIVADDLLARAGLASLLELHPICDVVGQISADRSLADDVAVYRPDVVLVDLGWHVGENLKTITRLQDSGAAVVALLARAEDATAAISGLAGLESYGLLLRDTDTDLLLQALETVLSGFVVLDPTLAAAVIPAGTLPLDPPPEALTARESEVLQLLARGLTNKAIAQQLAITDHTVKFHVNAIMGKLGAQSRTEAVVLATRAGLITL